MGGRTNRVFASPLHCVRTPTTPQQHHIPSKITADDARVHTTREVLLVTTIEKQQARGELPSHRLGSICGSGPGRCAGAKTQLFRHPGQLARSTSTCETYRYRFRVSMQSRYRDAAALACATHARPDIHSYEQAYNVCTGKVPVGT